MRGIHRNIVLDLRSEILLLEKYSSETVENVSAREDFLIQAEFIMMLAAVVIGISLAYYLAQAVVKAVRDTTNALNSVQSESSIPALISRARAILPVWRMPLTE